MLVAVNDWECLHADAVNAFLYASMALRASGQKVHVQHPQGYHLCGLLGALYGTNESPLLWRTGRVMVSIVVCVDDFAVAAPTKQEAQAVLAELTGHCQLKEPDDNHYLLGCRIVRSRGKRAIYITRDAYLDQTARSYELAGAATPSTPLPSEKLLVEVKWIPTAHQVADGLTKSPTTENHLNFCRQLDLAVVRNAGQPGKTLMSNPERKGTEQTRQTSQ